MEILVNGKKRTVQDKLSISQLLQQLEMQPDIVHVQLNDTIIDKGAYDETFLSEGDEVEILMFMGGGR